MDHEYDPSQPDDAEKDEKSDSRTGSHDREFGRLLTEGESPGFIRGDPPVRFREPAVEDGFLEVLAA